MKTHFFELVLWGVLPLFIGPSQASENSPIQIQQEAVDAVFTEVNPALVSLWWGEAPRAHATGTIISSDGLVLTCAHLPVSAGGDIEVWTADGKKITARVLGKTSKDGAWGNDLALVQLPGNGPWPFVTVGTVGEVRLDDPLLACGYPGTGLLSTPGKLPPYYLRMGYRVAYENTDKAGLIRTSMRGAGGDSGGPVLELRGRLIGVVTNFDPGGTGLTFNTVNRLRDEWKTLAGDRPALPAQEDARPTFPSLEEAFTPAYRAARGIVVEVRSRERCVAAGVIVGPGQVLTKASELGPDLTVVLEDDRVGIARLAAVDRVRDLALLDIPATDMTDGVPAVPWSESTDLPAGRLVVAVAPAAFRPATGMVAAAAQPIPPMEGGIAVSVQDAEDGVEITRVFTELIPLRLQFTYPLHVGDIITHFHGTSTPDMAGWIRAHEQWPVTGERPRVTGEPVTVRYRRDGVAGEVTLPLSASSNIKQLIRPYSLRYTGFPQAAVAQMHVTRPEMCGALVVDGSGRAIGVYIAKSPDVEDLVLPIDEVQASLAKLRDLITEKH
ncbi:MAG: trypsin-like peptidase domain-containing protein [Pirellulaceae bacterium]